MPSHFWGSTNAAIINIKKSVSNMKLMENKKPFKTFNFRINRKFQKIIKKLILGRNI